MPKAKPATTRTFGNLHFEDLEPHRFEDLIRQLIYDFKTWQSIEATGRSGSDDGFDVRAFEKAEQRTTTENERGDEIEEVHPMDGHQWMVQVKREKELGPKRVEDILKDVSSTNPPYGYILAAPATFSKQSYDLFRTTLRATGVLEFYLWGRSDLEDMLQLPKNDRILFTFFGISLVSKKRSRTTEIRSTVTIKNKAFKVFGEGHSLFERVLVRDLKDDKYPYQKEYPDFQETPRWKEYIAYEQHPLGTLFQVHEYLAYVDPIKKEWDFARAVDLVPRESTSDEDRQKVDDLRKKIEEVWDFFPKGKQGRFMVNGLIRFDEMAIIDEKGDTWHNYPHLYVDFISDTGPFSGFVEPLKLGEEYFLIDKWKKIQVFPKQFSKSKAGRIRIKPLELDTEISTLIKKGKITALYDVDGRYSHLKARDIVPVVNTDDGYNGDKYIQITTQRSMTVQEYLEESRNHWDIKHSLTKQLQIEDLEQNIELVINVMEFREIFRWTLERMKAKQKKPKAGS